MTHAIVAPNSSQHLVDLSARILYFFLVATGSALLFLTVFHLSKHQLPEGFTRLVETVVPFAETSVAEPDLPVAVNASDALPAHLQAVTEAISRRYRVAQPAVADVVRLAEVAAREARLDTFLVLAVIGIESRFNPYSESPFGAQGLMQVIGRFHTDKFEPRADGLALLDPETNIRVGVRILREYLSRTGDLVAALKLYGGETEVTGPSSYADKVQAERERLKLASQRNVRG